MSQRAAPLPLMVLSCHGEESEFRARPSGSNCGWTISRHEEPVVSTRASVVRCLKSEAESLHILLAEKNRTMTLVDCLRLHVPLEQRFEGLRRLRHLRSDAPWMLRALVERQLLAIPGSDLHVWI